LKDELRSRLQKCFVESSRRGFTFDGVDQIVVYIELGVHGGQAKEKSNIPLKQFRSAK
jgi:hypothetical protein